MRLTALLLKKKHVVPGFKWTGKHRLPHKIYPWNVEGMEKRLEIEDKNMFYLRHPYITLEQEFGSAMDLKKGKWLEKTKIGKAACKVEVSVRVEDRFAHLNKGNGNVWEL